VTWSLRFRQRDADQAVGVPELEPGDERRPSVRDGNRLLVLEPVADASPEELGETSQPRLVPAELGLEIAQPRSFVIEQTVELQPGCWHRHGDRGVVR
jgi:hypothetical protein